MKKLLPLFLLIAILSSCAKRNDEGIYDHGRLEYRITYLNAEEDNYDPSFLPRKMTLEFNQEYSINIIDGFMGIFKLGNMTHFDNNSVKTYLKVINENYAVIGEKNGTMCCFDCLEGIQYHEDTTTLNLAGLNSKHLKVTFKNSQESYDIYYTDEINLKNPNASNPYHKVDGVLTMFRLRMGPYDMLFTASKFDPSKSPESEMQIPEEAVLVEREVMVAILNRLMEQNL